MNVPLASHETVKSEFEALKRDYDLNQREDLSNVDTVKLNICTRDGGKCNESYTTLKNVRQEDEFKALDTRMLNYKKIYLSMHKLGSAINANIARDDSGELYLQKWKDKFKLLPSPMKVKADFETSFDVTNLEKISSLLGVALEEENKGKIKFNSAPQARTAPMTPLGPPSALPLSPAAPSASSAPAVVNDAYLQNEENAFSTNDFEILKASGKCQDRTCTYEATSPHGVKIFATKMFDAAGTGLVSSEIKFVKSGFDDEKFNLLRQQLRFGKSRDRLRSSFVRSYVLRGHSAARADAKWRRILSVFL